MKEKLQAIREEAIAKIKEEDPTIDDIIGE